MKTFTSLLFVCLISASQWAHSAYPKSDQDFGLLPEYCKARLGKTSREVEKLWKRRLGGDFIHVHHYCAGLHTRNIANKLRNKKDKIQTLEAAIREMSYIQKNASPKFILQPKVSYDIGKVYEQLGNTTKAMQSYYQSIKINPKLSPPYIAISDLLKRQGNTEEAINILKQGLKHKPDSKLLKKHLSRLTGK